MPKVKTYSERHTRRLIKAHAEADLRTFSSISVQNQVNRKVNRNGNPTLENQCTENIEDVNEISTLGAEGDENSFIHFEECEVDEVTADCPPLTSDESDTETEDVNVREELQQWAIRHQVTHSALNDLLKIIRNHECFSELPKDSRTLLKTPKTTALDPMPPGEYVHFGLENVLHILMADITDIPEEIVLQVGIVGLPVQKSNNKQFWPILAHISQPKLSVECVGIYSGKSKPENVSNYLQKLVDELRLLIQTGFKFKEKSVKLKLEALVCDAPARAFISATKNHSGYRGCSKCYDIGAWRRKVVFLRTDAKKRTDSLFRSRDDPQHHTGRSAIEDLPVDLIAIIPLDYMHLVCLGVMRRLISLWTRGPIAAYKISAQQQERISSQLEKVAASFGKDFARKPRSLKEVDHWKATEYRTFLLYSGPVVLKNVLHEQHYIHFLCLHVAITILCCPIKIKLFLAYAHSLLEYFVRRFIQIYGEENCTYNVHNLIHLAEDAKTIGTLDSFSAFRFENKLGQIKKLLKKPNCLLQQVHRRLEESNLSRMPLKKLCRKQKEWGGIECCEVQSSQFKNTFWKGFEIICQTGDNMCVLDDGSIVNVLSVANDNEGETVIVGRKFRKSENYYDFPCQSTLCSISEVKSKSCIKTWRLSEEILFKMEKPFLMAMFLKTKEVEVVPRSWVCDEDGKKYCFWPKFCDMDEIYGAARRMDTPNRKVWKRFAVRVFHEFDNYDTAVREIPHFLDFSDYEQSRSKQTENSVLSGSSHHAPCGYESDSDSDSAASMGSKFVLRPLEPPSPPSIPVSTPVSVKIAGKKLESKRLFSTNTATTSSHLDATPSNSLPSRSDDGTFEPMIHSVNGLNFDNLFQEIKDMKNVCSRNFAAIKLQQPI